MADLNRQRLIARIDCINQLSGNDFFSRGKVSIVSSPIGDYLEAEPRPLSRFGYRFKINNIRKPHVAIVRYPDDKRRFMTISDGTSYDLSTGILTGHEFPISGEMKALRNVFWPRWQDCSIVFMTWGFGEPAAVASVEIYELEELSPVNIPLKSSNRTLGIQYEDPSGMGAGEGSMNFEEWLDNIVHYARYTGQNSLAYPLCWYHGPLFPSKCEPADCISGVIAKDRKMYWNWTTHPSDWPAVLLERFEKEGLEFDGVLTLMRLGSLMQKMNTDLAAIQAGADTINNMLWCDRVQEGTNDWTSCYATENIPALLKRSESGQEWFDYSGAYNEKRSRDYHPGPIFNPLHPLVQKTVLEFIDELTSRYGRFPAFKGISINMWAPTILWYGSIHSGYDDISIKEFEKDTGIIVPVDSKLPNRFSKRYDFLTWSCRAIWIKWRCWRVHQFICAIRDVVVKARPDLCLTLTLWDEPYTSEYFGKGGVQNQIYARQSRKQLYKEAGLDLPSYENEPNIKIDLELDGGGRDRTWGMDANASLDKFFGFRDHDYLDSDTLEAIGRQSNAGVHIFNSWHEAWGKSRLMACDKSDSNLTSTSYLFGAKSEGIVRINSEYPPDGFWWESQSRITHAFPPDPHFMEQYAHAVAELDAISISRGGLFLDKAHSEEITRFALAYRALPKKKFMTVGHKTDPVAVRTLLHDNKRYVYAINRDYYPVEVEISFDQSPIELIDLTIGKNINGDNPLRLTLDSYELRSFSMNPEIKIISFITTPPESITSALLKDANSALLDLQTLRESGRFVPGMGRMEYAIKSAITEERWAWLRRAISSYIVCKCRELLKENR